MRKPHKSTWNEPHETHIEETTTTLSHATRKNFPCPIRVLHKKFGAPCPIVNMATLSTSWNGLKIGKKRKTDVKDCTSDEMQTTSMHTFPCSFFVEMIIIL